MRFRPRNVAPVSDTVVSTEAQMKQLGVLMRNFSLLLSRKLAPILVEMTLRARDDACIFTGDLSPVEVQPFRRFLNRKPPAGKIVKCDVEPLLSLIAPVALTNPYEYRRHRHNHEKAILTPALGQVETIDAERLCKGPAALMVLVNELLKERYAHGRPHAVLIEIRNALVEIDTLARAIPG